MPVDHAPQARLSPYSGEYLQPRMERRFRLSMQARNVHQLRVSLYWTAFLFPMIGVFDYLLLGLTREFYLLSAIRVVVAVAFLSLAVALGRNPRLINRDLPLNSAIVLLATALILVTLLRPETITAQITAVVAVTVAIYLFIPNRIPWAFATSLYLGTGFLAVVYTSGLLARPGIVGVLFTLFLTNTIGLITALRISQLQREQFSSLLAERKSNRRLQKEIKARQTLEESLRRLAQIDHLTGLNNRRWFSELLKQEIKRHHRTGAPLGLCMIDIDHFKKINDRKGHAAGDNILKAVAELLRKELRETDIIGRFGGEEFVVALPDSYPNDTYRIAEHLRTSVEKLRFPGELAELAITITIGITQVLDIEESQEAALARADKALYRGKNSGRNTVATLPQNAAETNRLVAGKG